MLNTIHAKIIFNPPRYYSLSLCFCLFDELDSKSKRWPS